MVRRSFWFFALVLLASCAQTPNPNVETPAAPQPTPAVLSTDLFDSAMGVAADAQGNAYVIG